MKMPKRVRIGESTYIIKMQHFIDFLNLGISGKINYSKKVVKIKKTSDKRMMEDVFFHEIAHGVLKEMEFNYPQLTKFRNDEAFTQELGLHLRTLFLNLLNDQEMGKQKK